MHDPDEYLSSAADAAELKRRQEAGELTPAEEAELRKLESKLAVLEEVMSGGLDPVKAARRCC